MTDDEERPTATDDARSTGATGHANVADDALASPEDGGGPANVADDAFAASADLTHTTDSGEAQMVDVGGKPDSRRRAVARGRIRLRPSTVAAIRADEIGKGDVLATARVGAIQAVKHTWEAIPMCHQIPITNVETEITLAEDAVAIEVAVETTGKTGCEMEAIQGVTTGLGVVWDMVKAVEKDAAGQYPETAIEAVRVVEKSKTRVD